MSLELRKYREEDLDRHLELSLMNDVYEEVNEGIRKEKKEWIEEAIDNYSEERPEFYTLVITLDGKMIGNIIAEKIDYENDTLEVGYWIGKKYWNKGYTTKILKMFLEEIKGKFGTEKAIGRVAEDNIASQRVLEKVGFALQKRDGEGKKVYSKEL